MFPPHSTNFGEYVIITNGKAGLIYQKKKKRPVKWSFNCEDPLWGKSLTKEQQSYPNITVSFTKIWHISAYINNINVDDWMYPKWPTDHHRDHYQHRLKPHSHPPQEETSETVCKESRRFRLEDINTRKQKSLCSTKLTPTSSHRMAIILFYSRDNDIWSLFKDSNAKWNQQIRALCLC